MLFNSLEFLIFFVVVSILYFSLKYKYRWMLLLLASCFFYMFFVPIYIFILFFTIIIDYYAAIYIDKFQGKKRKNYLILSIVANIGILVVFKYYNFFIDNFNEILHITLHTKPLPYLSILLPIGLSFHTFQALSYTIEVYRGNFKPEKHLGIYALYVMFYPQLVAGPIERPQNVLHQFYEKHNFDYLRVSNGLKLMAWGFFKKVVIADRFSTIANEVFNNATSYHNSAILFGVIAFTIQIYCDFSGYSDIALGSAKVMGFKLMKNFDNPYFSKNISEFWRRWHISLSSWFREYLYFSLGGNKVKLSRWFFNLLFVFLISGFWHGANFTFIIWGALHGFYLVFAIIKNKFFINHHNLFLQKNKFIYNLIQTISTFILVSFAWIFFRASSVSNSFVIIKNLFNELNFYSFYFQFKNLLTVLQMSSFDLLLYFCLVIFLLSTEIINSKHNIINTIAKYPSPVRITIYSLFTLIILLFADYEQSGQFIYFQF